MANLPDSTVPDEPAVATTPVSRRKPFGLRPRLKAAGTHFLICLAVATAVFLTIYFLWFPGVLFEGAGGRNLLQLIIFIDVTLGPLLTFIVFVPGKRSLVFDLSVIAALQLGALAYGVWTMFEIRPVYIVFAQDRFDLARANDISREELAKVKGTPLEKLPLDGPHLMGVKLPTDPDEQFRISQAALAGGPDLYGYPRYYRPYAEVRADVLRAAKPVDGLKRFNPASAVDAEVARIHRPAAELRFLPLRTGMRDLSVLVDARTGDVVAITGLSPWT